MPVASGDRPALCRSVSERAVAAGWACSMRPTTSGSYAATASVRARMLMNPVGPVRLLCLLLLLLLRQAGRRLRRVRRLLPMLLPALQPRLHPPPSSSCSYSLSAKRASLGGDLGTLVYPAHTQRARSARL